ERFVRPEDIAESIIDAPMPLDEEGLATVSAPHAYLLSFRVLGLRRGDRLAELGTGSGYGAALASEIVGPEGSVDSIEIDDGLALRAARLLERYSNVRVSHGDASASFAGWSGFNKVTVTFAVDEMPDTWLSALPEGGKLVAPVGAEGNQRLTLYERTSGMIHGTDHGAVRYVRNRADRRATTLRSK